MRRLVDKLDNEIPVHPPVAMVEALLLSMQKFKLVQLGIAEATDLMQELPIVHEDERVPI